MNLFIFKDTGKQFCNNSTSTKILESKTAWIYSTENLKIKSTTEIANNYF
jgi:hypothetical protein